MKIYSLVVLVSTLFFSTHSCAFNSANLWLRPDQQGARLYMQQNYIAAAERFQNPLWRGVAYYRAGNYQAAVEQFNQLDSSLADYNRGNALAKLGQFSAALNAYSAALKKDPGNVDAQYNKALLEKLLQEQQKQNQTQPSSQTKNDDKQQSNDSSSTDQSNPSNQQQQTSNEQKQSRHSENEKASAPEKKEASQNKSQAQENNQQKNDKKTVNDQQEMTAEAKDQENVEGEKQVSAAISAKQQELKEAEEQGLQRIPDDPGGLLQRKFIRDHLRQQGEE